jgi:formylmethanofuran dehydrogenase subunit E
MPDNYSQWEWHDREQERSLNLLPVCDKCKERIDDDHYFYIHGEILCEDCMIERYRRNTEDYIR